MRSAARLRAGKDGLPHEVRSARNGQHFKVGYIPPHFQPPDSTVMSSNWMSLDWTLDAWQMYQTWLRNFTGSRVLLPGVASGK